MNEKQIKRKLEDKGIKIADLASEVAEEFGVKVNSADNMLRQLIAGQRWYPAYADWLKSNYGITVDRPKWLLPVRERMRLAA